jgi:hypothetical protein
MIPIKEPFISKIIGLLIQCGYSRFTVLTQTTLMIAFLLLFSHFPNYLNMWLMP